MLGVDRRAGVPGSWQRRLGSDVANGGFRAVRPACRVTRAAMVRTVLVGVRYRPGGASRTVPSSSVPSDRRSGRVAGETHIGSGAPRTSPARRAAGELLLDDVAAVAIDRRQLPRRALRRGGVPRECEGPHGIRTGGNGAISVRSGNHVGHARKRACRTPGSRPRVARPWSSASPEAQVSGSPGDLEVEGNMIIIASCGQRLRSLESRPVQARRRMAPAARVRPNR